MESTSKLSTGSQLHERSDVHLLRKFWHVGTGFTGLLIYNTTGMGQQTMATILLTVALIGFALDFSRLRIPAVNALTIKIAGPFMRESEANGWSGLPFYALGTSLSLFFYEEKIAILAILFLMFSDPISSYFGIRFGREKILPNKSLQGSVAGFLTCYLVTIFYCLETSGGMSLLLFALLAGVVGALSELLSIFVDDNLTIPLVSGAGLTLLNVIFQVI